jgi:hypothetical protein
VSLEYLGYLRVYPNTSFLTKMPTYTTANVDITHPSLHDVAAMQIVTTNANCTQLSLPPFQSPTADPSPPSIGNEEVVVLGVVSSPAEAMTPAANAAVNSTRAAGKKDTEVSNVIAFFRVIASTSLQMPLEGLQLLARLVLTLE